MSKIGNYIIELAEIVAEKLNDNLKPEYLDSEMRDLLNEDDFSFYTDNIDIILETSNNLRI